MAAVTITIPNAALAALDAYAQRRNYPDYRAMLIEWCKNNARLARIEENRLQANDLIAQVPPDVNVT